MRKRSGWSSVLGVGVCLLMLGTTTACDEQKNVYQAPPPPRVTVAPPVKRTVTDYAEFTGNTQTLNSVELVARVEGFLTKVNFEDGAIVKKGELLFVIEPEQYQAQVELNQAQVAVQSANLQRAQSEYARQQRLIRQNATSQADLERWQAERDAAVAAVNEARARLDLARINLGYTEVMAPFTGSIGRRLVDPGNLVGDGRATTLARLEQLDPIYVFINVNERDVLTIRDRLRQEHQPNYRERVFPMEVGLQTEEGYPHVGRVDFVAPGLDPNTGTLLVRGIFPNPDYVLVPGLFVRVRVPIGERKDALLVPTRAIGVSQAGQYVLVVNNQNVVDTKIVHAGARIDEMRVIESGLDGNERVVVDGIQRARPGATVTPVQENGGKPTTAPPAGS